MTVKSKSRERAKGNAGNTGNTGNFGRAAMAAPSPMGLAPEIREGQSVELLKELHILTREGKLNQDSRRKLKQVYHLYQFIEKLLLELEVSGHQVTLADHGAWASSFTTCFSRPGWRGTFTALKLALSW